MPVFQAKVTGVYCAINVITGKRYVGSASRCVAGRRWLHIHHLRRGIHHSIHLQRAWDKYGEEAFEWSILEKCSADNCVAREQYWIDKLETANQDYGYNLSPTAGSPRGLKHGPNALTRTKSAEHRAKMSVAQKARFANGLTQEHLAHLKLIARLGAQARWDKYGSRKGGFTMPAQKQKVELLSNVLGKDLDKIHKEIKGEETTVNDFGDLPPGIEDGRATITQVAIKKFATGDNKGKPYFSAQASVITPKKYMNTSIEGTELGMVKCEGRLTRIGPEPLCNTPKARGRKTLKEHLSWVYNQLRLMGVDTDAIKTGKELDAAIAQLNKDQPEITFRTWRGRKTKAFPNPRTNHTWLGLAEETEETEETDEIQEDDDTVGATEEEEEGEKETEDSDETDEEEAEEEEKAEEEAEEEEGEEEPDLEALAKAADKKNDDAAITKLKELAKEAGIPTKKVGAAKKWADVATMIQEAKDAAQEGEEEEEGETEEATDEGETEEEGEEGEWVPEVGQLYFYKPKDKATGKPAKKAVECEIMEVDEDSKTVKLQNNDDKKTKYIKVPFDKLIGSDEA